MRWADPVVIKFNKCNKFSMTKVPLFGLAASVSASSGFCFVVFFACLSFRAGRPPTSSWPSSSGCRVGASSSSLSPFPTLEEFFFCKSIFLFLYSLFLVFGLGDLEASSLSLSLAAFNSGVSDFWRSFNEVGMWRSSPDVVLDFDLLSNTGVTVTLPVCFSGDLYSCTIVWRLCFGWFEVLSPLVTLWEASVGGFSVCSSSLTSLLVSELVSLHSKLGILLLGFFSLLIDRFWVLVSARFFDSLISLLCIDASIIKDNR